MSVIALVFIALVIIGAAGMVAGPVLGIVTYNEQRSSAMRAMESEDPDRIKDVKAQLAAHQEKFIPAKRAELDRHPDYIGNLVGVLGVSIGLVAGHIPHGTALFGIPPTLQHSLAFGMGISAAFGVAGIVITLKDNRLSYVLGIGASLGIMVAMGVYEAIIVLHSNLVGVLGGGLALTITGARMWIVPRLWREVQNLNKLRVKIDRRLGPKDDKP